MAQAPPVVCGVKQGPGPPPVTGNTDRLCNDGDDGDTPGDGDDGDTSGDGGDGDTSGDGGDGDTPGDGDDGDTPGDGEEEEVQCTAAQQTGRRWGQGSAAARVLLLLLLLLWHNQVTQHH